MKRKMPAQKPLSAAAPAETVRRESPNAWDAVQVCLFTALLFLAMTVQTGRMSVLLPVLALALCLGREPLRRLRERFCVPVLGFAAFGAACGLAAVYAAFGSYAVKEYYKLIASFSVGTVLLVRFDRKHVRGLLWGLCAVCAAIALLSADAAVDGGLYRVFLGLIEDLGGSFTGVSHQASARINGIYNDANITAGIFALGALTGLHLSLTGRRRWERGLACLLTGMNGMGFFMAMSRGAILCFGLALLVYLAAVGGRERTSLLLLILLNAGVTVALSVPASSAVVAGSGLATALTLLCGLPVFLLYELPARWAARKLAGHGLAVAAVAAAFALGAGAWAVKALGTTGPYTFETGEALLRSVSLPAGSYTLETECTGEVVVEVLHLLDDGGREDLFYGKAEKAAFTLDEPLELTLAFHVEPGETLSRAAVSDGTEIPLDYPLLPAFVANRMQEGFIGGQSMSLRLQYDRDGWALFRQRPLLGWGMGSTEGTLTSVQPFYYETLFLHNHVLQVLCDCGLLGGIPFLAFLLGVLWLTLRRLWRSRREGGDPLAAALLACWVMSNAHGLMELNFSIRAYQCAAFTALLLPVVLYGTPLLSPERERGRRACGFVFAGALCLYLGVFAVLLECHRAVEREARDFEPVSVEDFMETTRRWIRMDVFDQEQNKLNFVGNAVLLGNPEYEADAARWAKDLRKTGTYSACTGVAEYYYLPRGELSEAFACSREAVAQEASSSDAWNQQVDFYRWTVLPAVGPEDAAVFLEGCAALEDYLRDYSRGRQEEIRLTEESRAFLDRVRRARDSGLEGEAALLYLSLPVEAESGTDG